MSFIGRSLFRASVELPVNVPIGRYTAQVFLFRDGKLLSQSQSSLEVKRSALSAWSTCSPSTIPSPTGCSAVLMAVSAGLLAWTVFRRE